MFAELASAENVSSCGVRVRTELPWKTNARVFVKLPEGGMWTRARIAYCRRLKGERHALGLEFYEASHRYNLTFRCIHCGSYQASANFRSDRQESEAEIQARIYQVQCAACGRRGEACGFSALRILRYKSVETRSEANATLVWPPVGGPRAEWERNPSGAA